MSAREQAVALCDRPHCRDYRTGYHGLADRRSLWLHRSVEFAGSPDWYLELRAIGDGLWHVHLGLHNGLVVTLAGAELARLAHGLGLAKRRLARANADLIDGAE